jgi:hypothetical protein
MRVSVSDYRAAVDAAGEREGAASDWFELLTDQPQPVPLVRLRMFEAADPRAREFKAFRYPRGRATRAWVRYLDALYCGRAPSVRSYMRETRHDRERQAARRRRRAATLRRLLKLDPATPPVPLRRAAALIRYGVSTLEHAKAHGRLKIVRIGARRIGVTVPALCEFLAARVA